VQQKNFWKFSLDAEITAFFFTVIIIAIVCTIFDNYYLNISILVFLIYYASLIYLRGVRSLLVLLVSLIISFLDAYSTYLVLSVKNITGTYEFMVLFRMILKSKHVFLSYSIVFVIRLVACMVGISYFVSSLNLKRKNSGCFGLLELAKPDAIVNGRAPFFKEMLRFLFDPKLGSKYLEVNYLALRSLKLTVHRSFINYIWLSVSIICTNIAMLFSMKAAYYIDLSYYIILMLWIVHLIVLRRKQGRKHCKQLND